MNAYWPAYDSSVTCGYRDVLVNMCFENDITTREFFEHLSNLCMCRVTIYALWFMYVVCVWERESTFNASFISFPTHHSFSRSISRSLFSQALASTGTYANCSLRWKSLWHWGVWMVINVMLTSEICAANSLIVFVRAHTLVYLVRRIYSFLN